MKILRNTIYAIRPIWRIDRRYVIFSILYTFENIPRRLLNVLIIKYIVDAATEGKAFSTILLWGIAFLFMEISLTAIKHCFSHIYKVPHEELIRAELKRQMMKKSMSFDLKCFDDTEFYDAYTRAFSALDKVAFDVLNTLVKLLAAILSVLTLGGYIFIIDPVIILVSLLGSAVSIFSNSLISKVSYSEKEKQVLPARKCAYAQDIFFSKKNAKDLRTERLSEVLMRMFDDSFRQRQDIIDDHEKKLAGLKTLFNTPLDMSDMFMWLYIAYGIIHGTFKAGDFMSMSNAVWSLSQQLRNVFNAIPQLQESALYTDDIIKFEDYIPTVSSGEKEVTKSFSHTIQFEDVSFGYKKNAPVLKKISFCVSSGQKLAIVGHNGAGKSTLIKLVLRLYDAETGCVTLDGIPYGNYDLEQLRAQFSVVFQDYQCYALSVAENILMRKPETQQEEQVVIETLKKVHLYDKVSSFKNGIYTILTKEFEKDGEELSGGEYQKMAIARALVKDSPIVIMDEPSSALDPLAERELDEVINSCFKNKLVIIISHKLSMTRNADAILLLEQGIVIEQGTHEQLMERKGKYAEMWKAQAQKYIAC